ncbi:MAG: 50S ribosomal protein L9 [Myxococcota bacterium]
MAIDLILTEDIEKLGHAGDVVHVKPGYARNYLLPQGKAMLATKGRVRELEHKKRVIEERLRKQIANHEAMARRLDETELEFRVRAGGEGKLFGSVTSAEIARRLAEQGVEIDRRRIELDDPIKQLGEYEVAIRLHREVTGRVRVRVIDAADTEGSTTD